MQPAMLRLLLVLVLIAVQMVAVGLLWTGTHNQTTSQISRTAQSALGKIAVAVTHQARDLMKPAANAATLVADMIHAGMLDPHADEQLAQFLLAQMRAGQALSGAHLVREDGSAVSVIRVDDNFRLTTVRFDPIRSVSRAEFDEFGLLLRRWQEPGDLSDLRTQPWYQKARATTIGTWSTANAATSQHYAGATNALGITTPQGERIGVIGFDVDVRPLSSLVSNAPLTANGVAVLIDEQQRILATSDWPRLPESLQQSGQANLAQLNDPALVTLAAQRDLHSSDVMHARIDDQASIGLRRHLSLANGQVNWLFMVHSPVMAANSGLDAIFNRNLLTSAIILLLPALAAIAAALGWATPIFRRRVATTDRLTGAMTRAEFRKHLVGMLQGRRAHEANSHIVVVALDLDGFKGINDNYGHHTGDQVLRQFVDRLSARLRPSDLLARTGADEFLMAMRLPDTCEPLLTINRIRTRAVVEAFETENGLLHIGATAGLAIHETREPIDRLLARADQALITGKVRQKNRCYLAPSHTDKRSQPSAIKPPATPRHAPGQPLANATQPSPASPVHRPGVAPVKQPA